MFANELMIAAIFRIFNFCLVIVLAIYCFKTYVLPNVLSLMAKKASEKDFLLSQQSLFEQRQTELDELILHDQHVCNQLKKNVDHWKNAVDLNRQISQTHRTLQALEYAKKQSKKNTLRQEKLTQSVVTNKLVYELEQSLSKHFEDESAGLLYVDTITQLMRKNIL